MNFPEKAKAGTSRRALGKKIAEECFLNFHYDAIVVCLWDDEHHVLLPLYGEDTSSGDSEPKECPLTMFVGRPDPPRRSLINRKPNENQSEFDPFGDDQRLSRSLLFVPVIRGGRPIGMISVQSYTPFRYDEQDLKVLEDIAKNWAYELSTLRLATNELNLREAINHSASMILITDPSGRIEYANRRFLQETGFKLEEVIGESLRSLKGDDLATTAFQQLWRTILSGKPWKGNFLNKKKDGQSQEVEAQIIPVCDEDGTILQFLCIQEDITERRRHEQALLRRDAILKAVGSAAELFLRTPAWRPQAGEVLEKIALAVECRAASIVRAVSDAVPPHFQLEAGWGQARMLRRTMYGRLTLEQFWPACTEDVQRSIFDGRAVFVDGVRDKEETAHRVGAAAMFPLFESGRFWGYVVFEDHRQHRKWEPEETEALRAAAGILEAALHREELERQSREQDRMTRVLLDGLPAAALLLDCEGHVLASNRLQREILRIDDTQILHRPIFDLLTDNEREGRRHVFERALRKKIPVFYEDMSRGREWNHSLYPVLDNEESVCSVIMISQDVTQDREKERLASLGATASGLAHYIKNVSLTLSGSTRMLDHAIENEDLSTIKRLWPVVGRSTLRIDKLARNILALSRTLRLDKDSVSMTHFLLDVVEDVAPWAEEEDIRLDTKIDDLPIVHIDVERFHDAMLNILSNSIEALRERVHARDRRVLVTGSSLYDEDEVEIAVEDNGPGIPEDAMKKLFQPFFTTKGSRGTGLGLTMARRVVEAHGGRITAQVLPQGGTRIVITLPVVTTNSTSYI